jgi:hypothetical protein
MMLVQSGSYEGRIAAENAVIGVGQPYKHIIVPHGGFTEPEYAAVGITERATMNILRDLEGEGYLTRVPQGRRTHYVVNQHRPFRHPAEADHRIGDLLALFG